MIRKGKLYPEVLGALEQLVTHTKAGEWTCHLPRPPHKLGELTLEGIRVWGRQWGGGVRDEDRPLSTHSLGFPQVAERSPGHPVTSTPSL